MGQKLPPPSALNKSKANRGPTASTKIRTKFLIPSTCATSQGTRKKYVPMIMAKSRQILKRAWSLLVAGKRDPGSGETHTLEMRFSTLYRDHN